MGNDLNIKENEHYTVEITDRFSERNVEGSIDGFTVFVPMTAAVPKLIENGMKLDIVILDLPRKGSDKATLKAIISASQRE